MEKVELGGVYNLRQLRGIPYVVINKSDKAVDVEVVIQSPNAKDMKDGYEPVPDIGWMKVTPNKFKMEPGDVVPADVVLAVPNDPSLVGRHYQAHILARTTGASLLQVGVVSAVRFSIGTLGPDALKAESKPEKSLVNFDVDVTPQTLMAPSFPLGKTVDLKKEMNLSLKVTNRGDSTVKFKVLSVGVDSRLMVGGYAAGDPAWLKTSVSSLKVKPNRIEDVKLKINIPNTPENAGRKLMLLVKFELDGMDMPLELYGKVLVTTQGEKKD